MNYFNQESDRLHYRKLTTSDIPSWLEFFDNNNRLEYLGMDDSRSYQDLATEWVMKQLERYNESGLGHLAVIGKEKNELIALAGIIPRLLNNQTYFEIGYSIKPKYWGFGYATEMAQQMKSFGKNNQIAEKFISIIHIDNHPSMNVAKKNGMKPLFNSTYLGFDVIVYGE